MKPAPLIHPFLFAAFPVLFLYSHNVCNFSPSVIFLPLLAAGALAAVCWGLFALLLHSGRKAALLTTVFLLLFQSYGHVHNLLVEAHVWARPLRLGPDRIVFMTFTVLFLITVAALIRTRKPLGNPTRFANLLGAILVAGSLLQIGFHALSSINRPDESAWRAAPRLPVSKPQDSSALPHIFYIILDGYARGDVLADLYDFDNSALLDRLREYGFHVAKQARSNYCQTTLSLASSMNLVYLDGLAARMGTDSRDREPLRKGIKDSQVARWLRQLGYTYVAFATGYFSTAARDADIFLSPDLSLNEFQNTLLNTTPVPALLHLLGNSSQVDLHRNIILYTLDHLGDALDLDTPAFVFAHIVVPHPPFVFGPNGEKLRPGGRFTLADGSDLIRPGGLSVAGYRQRYRDQLAFLNNKLPAALDPLVRHGRRPVIIILQGDHGPGSNLAWEDSGKTDMWERFSILNAYRFPDGDYQRLDDAITPVNTFRVILNQYFGARFERLPDRSFFSGEKHPYDLIDVTAPARSAPGLKTPQTQPPEHLPGS